MFTTIAVISRILSNSVANLFQKKASSDNSPILINLCAYFVMSVLCVLPALFVDWFQFSLDFWINVFFAGMLCTVGTISLIEALKCGELSVLAPINSYKSVIGLIGAFLLLGELPAVKELVCVIFIVIGSYFVLDTGGERFSLHLFFRRDIRLRFFALICSGVEASFLKKIILMSSYKISLILWCFSGFVCSVIILIIYKLLNRSCDKLSKDGGKYCIIIAIMLLVMQLTTNYVFSRMAVGTALALFQLSSLISLYFGYKFYNESEIIKKLVGTIIMISSAVVILI